MSTVRKFRVWDSNFINSVLEKSQQIKYNIENLAKEAGEVSDLPKSVVPTEFLHNLVSCYEAVFNLLLDHDLVSAGYPKKSSTLH